ncbi:MAG: ATP-binding protein [Bacteroidia bacterium]|nr:ATP-binding protein [Bacteroidia bacterium]
MTIPESKSLTISSKTENIVVVETLINEICDKFKISEDHYGNILVALTEAVNNAIQHGNKNNPSKHINISFNIRPDHISFTIKDEGLGFDFSHIPDPTAPENIEKPNGRGVFLMKNLADNIEFEDNGSTVKLDFKTGK